MTRAFKLIPLSLRKTIRPPSEKGVKSCLLPCRPRVVTSSVVFLANVATPRLVTLASDTYSVAKKAGCYKSASDVTGHKKAANP